MGARGFISLDVETANSDFGSICAIGLALFMDNQFVRQIGILVDPEDYFDPHNIAIHGIRPEDVAGKPTMAKVFPAIAAQLTNTIVTHHSPFDRGALKRAANRYGVNDLSFNWIDTVAVARRTWRELKGSGGYGLKSLSQYHNFQFQHHNAAEDARASGLIMLKALEDSGLDLEDWLELLESKEAVATSVHSRKREVFAKYAALGAEGGRLAGETIVFTGFLTVPRAQAATMAAAVGCTVADGVTKKTTIMVVGDQDLRMTKGKEKSSKHLKAERLIASGVAIRIVQESDFKLMVAG